MHGCARWRGAAEVAPPVTPGRPGPRSRDLAPGAVRVRSLSPGGRHPRDTASDSPDDGSMAADLESVRLGDRRGGGRGGWGPTQCRTGLLCKGVHRLFSYRIHSRIIPY